MSSIPPWKRGEGDSPVAEDQARRSCADTGVPGHARKQRARLSCSIDEGKWENHGIGLITIDYIKESREPTLTIVDEDNITLLLHNITSDDIYQKRNERTISWKDPEKSMEFALSFEEASGCSYIWHSVRNIQQNLQSDVLPSQVGPRPAFECQETSRESLPNVDSLVSVDGELKDLPPLDLSSLPLMLKIVLERGTADQMRVAKLISQDESCVSFR